MRAKAHACIATDGQNDLRRAVTAAAAELWRLPPGEGIPSAGAPRARRLSEGVLGSRAVLAIAGASVPWSAGGGCRYFCCAGAGL